MTIVNVDVLGNIFRIVNPPLVVRVRSVVLVSMAMSIESRPHSLTVFNVVRAPRFMLVGVVGVKLTRGEVVVMVIANLYVAIYITRSVMLVPDVRSHVNSVGI